MLNATKRDKRGAGPSLQAPAPSLTNYVVIPFAFAPVIFTCLLFAARHFATRFFSPDPFHPPFLTLPLVGGSLGPGILGTSLFLVRAKAFSFLPRFLAKFISMLPAILLLLHNFFTVFYGNINNDSWSNSLMIDVVGPPETFHTFTRIPPYFTPATNPAAWANESVLAGPHLDVEGIRSASCGPRMFARFMWHRITPRARIHTLLTDRVMFGGIWVMSQGTTDGRCALLPAHILAFVEHVSVCVLHV
jgi:hypothetical protein